MQQTSIYLRDEQHSAVSEIQRESQQRDEFPDLSKSDALRKLIDVGISEADLGDLVSEERRILLERERFMDEQGKVKNLRTGFKPRVKRHFTERFESGVEPEQIEEWAENMHREVMLLWPEWSEESEEYAERREELHTWIDQVVSAYRERYSESARDPLDPEEIFSHYSGVEEGQEQQEQQEQQERLSPHIERAADMLRDGTPESKVKRRLTDVYGASDLEADEAVRLAKQRSSGVSPGGVAGDD